MIHYGCRIVQNIQRPDPALIERFRKLPAANVDDCMNRIGAVASNIVPVNRGKLAGPSFTIRLPQGDNLMLHAAMDLAKPGDVLVIDAGGFADRAIFGELMATYCKTRGIAGMVCDGAIRDRDALAEMEDFPIYAKGATPNGPYKNGPGEINVPVVIGGKVVRPGDILLGDGDGVVIIPPEEAEQIASAAEAVEEKEKKIMEHILRDGTYVRPWVEEKLKELGCEVE